MILSVIFGGAALILAAYSMYQRSRERASLERISAMLEKARNGSFRPESFDESICSSIENSMRLFLQDSLIAEANLQAQKNSIETLISDISHQTITPLSNIMLYSQLLEEELQNNTIGKEPKQETAQKPESMERQEVKRRQTLASAEQKAGAVRTQAEKLDFLLQSLVKMSRLENGIIKTDAQPCEIRRLMRSVVAQCAGFAEKKNITIVVSTQENKGDSIALCDPKWTAEACFNILHNAVKYTEDGGLVTIRITDYPMFVRIDVADNGVGIEQEELSQIFGRFYRGAAVKHQEGVGLGLYLAREILQCQGGYVKAVSKKGEGSCFSIFLPEGREKCQNCNF